MYYGAAPDGPCAPCLQVERVEKSGGAIYKNVTDGAALSYLDGSRPGDFGFDPLVRSRGYLQGGWREGPLRRLLGGSRRLFVGDCASNPCAARPALCCPPTRRWLWLCRVCWTPPPAPVASSPPSG